MYGSNSPLEGRTAAHRPRSEVSAQTTDNAARLDPGRGSQAAKRGFAASPGPGVYSEVGKLRTVLVCRPGLAHRRLSPHICRELKFEAPLWVERAQRDFAGFVDALTERGVEVLELHSLLVQILASAQARAFLLDRLLDPFVRYPGIADGVGSQLPNELRAACENVDGSRLADLLIGGATLADLGLPSNGALSLALALHPFVLPPLPHTLCMRESHSWVQHGMTLNRAGWRGPRSEALLVAAVYRFHPRFESLPARIWWGENPDATGTPCACAEGGDIMPLGHGVVLIGTGVRTQAQAALQIAHSLFEGGTAQNVIVAQMPRLRGGEALERVFTQCSPDVVTYRPDVVDRISCQEMRPGTRGGAITLQARAGVHLLDVLSEALDAPTLNAIATGADADDEHAEAWDDGNGVLAVEPGVVIAFERNTRTNKRLRQAGVEVIEVPGDELARVGATTHALCCPIARDAVA